MKFQQMEVIMSTLLMSLCQPYFGHYTSLTWAIMPTIRRLSRQPYLGHYAKLT